MVSFNTELQFVNHSLSLDQKHPFLIAVTETFISGSYKIWFHNRIFRTLIELISEYLSLYVGNSFYWLFSSLSYCSPLCLCCQPLLGNQDRSQRFIGIDPFEVYPDCLCVLVVQLRLDIIGRSLIPAWFSEYVQFSHSEWIHF